MKFRNVFAALLVLGMLFSGSGLAEEDVSITEVMQEIDLDAPVYGDVAWTFPVALEDMQPEYIILVNNHYMVGKKYVCNPLVQIKQLVLNKDGTRKKGDMFKADKNATMKLNETCAEALIRMSDAAREEGFNLYLKSAYRSYGQQASIWERHLKNGKPDGWAVKAGASDHQTGLGCDVVPGKWKSKSMNSNMAAEPECIWMAEHCAEYGFVIRYPEDKKEYTEVNYEPWHVRYVGVPVATYIMENGLCLEEFNDELQEAIRQFIADGGDPALVEAFIRESTDE